LICTVAVASLLAACLLLATPCGVVAQERELAEWDEYAERVSRAREVAADASGELMDSRAAADLAARIYTLVPARESVRIGDDQIVSVDNSVLRSLLTELDTGEDPRERAEALEKVSAHLVSLESAVGIVGDPVPSDPQLLAELLDDRQVDTSAVEEFIARALQRLAEWVGSLFGEVEEGGGATVLDWMVRVLVAVLAAILGYVAYRVIQRIRRSAAERDMRLADVGGAPIVAAAEGLPADALAHADGLAAAGRYREAVRALYGGAARSLVDAGAVKQTRTLTSGELLAAAAPAIPRGKDALARLTSAFDAAWYGHRDPGETGYVRARADHVAIVAESRPTSGDEAA
jgi:hypothetical protein